jgi:drug/metabolite transporter (DMT)-like permease
MSAGSHGAPVVLAYGRGAWLAALAAIAFGATAPLVQRAGAGVGAFTTAALLYAGAALASLPPSRAHGDEALRAGDAPRVALVATLGAVIGPAALAWGLQRTSAVTGSLLLNLEALFTVMLARGVWGEPIGRRVGVALLSMLAGGALLVARGGSFGVRADPGALAIAGATLAWAADNVLGRPLADRDPTQVVLAKSMLGAAASLAVARSLGESLPSARAAVALLLCGVAGYGLSLRLYLSAQRAIGAGRTGSVFAAAPFVGAALAWALGQRADGLLTLAAVALCGLGVWLHVTERGHEHQHLHEAVEHTHAHRHDDGHHAHPHDAAGERSGGGGAEAVEGEHTHPHRHEAVAHSHPHALDVHHRHRH